MKMKMKRILLYVFFNILSLGFAQAQVGKPQAFKVTKDTKSIKKDVVFEIRSLYYDPLFEAPKYASSTSVKTISPSYVLKVVQGGKENVDGFVTMPKGIQFLPVEDNLNSFWYAKNLESLPTISEIQDLYVVRADLESEANDYLNVLEKYDLIYDDPYLESYLYSIVTKILPIQRADGFPYDLKIVIVRDESLNACVFPNGVLAINTGLLSELHTEDELVAVLAHEIGHFIGNHSLVNIRKMQKAKARAEFWAGFATVAAGVLEAATSVNNNYYYDGSLTYSTAVLSYSIAEGFLDRIGTNYSREQEEEADKMALKVLSYLGYDKNGLASLFQRMADAYDAEGNWAAYYLSGDHPSLQARISYSGTPAKKTDISFERKVSFVITEAAISKYSRGRFLQALRLVDENIKNNVGTDDDYLIKALCTLNLYSDTKHNNEVQALIQEAKRINPSNSNILRTEIIAFLRSNDNARAKELLNSYQHTLTEQLQKQEHKESSYFSFLKREQEWARKMSIKVKGL